MHEKVLYTFSSFQAVLSSLKYLILLSSPVSSNARQFSQVHEFIICIQTLSIGEGPPFVLLMDNSINKVC